jgi:hypothetical protein
MIQDSKIGHRAVLPEERVMNRILHRDIGKFRDECLNKNWFVSLSDVPADDRAMAAALQPGASALGIWATERRRSFEQK